MVKIENRIIVIGGGDERRVCCKGVFAGVGFVGGDLIQAGPATTDIWLTNGTDKTMAVYLGFCMTPVVDSQQKLVSEVPPGKRLIVHQISRLGKFFPRPRECALVMVQNEQQILFVIDENVRRVRVGNGEWGTGWGPYASRVGLYRIDYYAIPRGLYADYEIRVTRETPLPARAVPVSSRR